MRAVLGIGNPGKKYGLTRHNIGFLLLDKFAELQGLKFDSKAGNYEFAEGSMDSSAFFLAKPDTYVNKSGLAALEIITNTPVRPQDLLVISDDISLPSGSLRIRKSGGDGGHNGLKSIIYYLGTKEFPRIRFGIGDDFEQGKMADYVLSRLQQQDLVKLEGSFQTALSLIENFILGGIDEALNFYSRNGNASK